MSAPPLVSRSALIALLRREQYETDAGYDAVELAKRRGWNARARELIAWLEQGSVEAGFEELRQFDLSDTERG